MPLMVDKILQVVVNYNNFRLIIISWNEKYGIVIRKNLDEK